MYVIYAGRLIDGRRLEAQPDMAVVVEHERIVQVAARQELALDPQVEVIDAREKTLMPGMIDCHVHIHSPGGPDDNYSLSALRELQGTLALRAGFYARQALEMGFTSLRSLSSPAYVDIALREAIDQGYLTGPRLRAAGQGICVTGGHMDKAEWNPEVQVLGRTGVGDGPWELRRAARAQLKRGADVIKINPCGGSLYDLREPWHQEMTYEEMAAVCEEAHWAHVRVAAHVSGGPGLSDALRAGVDSVEHGPWLEDEQIELMAKRGVCYVPTLAVNSRGIAMGKEALKASDAEWDWLLKNDEDKWVSLERAKKAGVKVCVGTDAGFWIYHGENAQELEELVKGGFTPMEAIIAATRVGAECLDLDDQVGTLEAGKLADMVLLDGDPLSDIRILQDKARIVQVYKGGRAVKPA